MLPLRVLGHCLSRATLVNAGPIAQVQPLGVVAEGLPGSAATQGFATSGFKHPALIPSSQGIEAPGVWVSDFTLLQSTSDIPLPERRTSAPEHNASVNHMPTNLTMIFLSQEISQVLSKALSQTTG